MSKLPGELERSLPAVVSLNTSLSHSQSVSSQFLPPPPEKRRAISDVRRTFCLFVTFDLLFISLLWIIELNVSGVQLGAAGAGGGVSRSQFTHLPHGRATSPVGLEKHWRAWQLLSPSW